MSSPLLVENPKLDIISKNREIAEFQERIAHLQKTVEQKNLDLARLQGQVVDMESIRASNQALLVKKTQVECERDELQKKYIELQKKYSEAVKRVVDMEKKNEEYLSDFEKKVTVIHQEETEQVKLEKDNLVYILRM